MSYEQELQTDTSRVCVFPIEGSKNKKKACDKNAQESFSRLNLKHWSTTVATDRAFIWKINHTSANQCEAK